MKNEISRNLERLAKTPIEEIVVMKLKEVLDEVTGECQRLKYYIDDDPLKRIIDANLEFKKLLETHQGEARLTKEFGKKVNELHLKEQKARRDAERYKLTDLCERECRMKMFKDKLTSEIANREFYTKRRNGL